MGFGFSFVQICMGFVLFWSDPMKCTETKYFQWISNGFWWGAAASGLLSGYFRVSFWYILQQYFHDI